MYSLFNRILPIGAISFPDLSITMEAMLLYIIYTVSAFIFLFCAISTYLKGTSNGQKILIFFAILFTDHIIWGPIQCGNSSLLVLILLIFAMDYKDSPSRYKREIALILIAIASGIKVYPCVFGLLYLREKRWKDALRLIIYGIFFFFMPFSFFGGIDGLLQFFKNQFQIQTSHTGIEIWTFNSLFCYISHTAPDILWTKILTLLIGAVILVVFLLAPLEKWEQFFLLVSIIVLIPLWSGPYTLSYFALPLLTFINQLSSSQNITAGKRSLHWLYLIFFAFLFSSSTFLELLGDGKTTFIKYCSLYFALLVLIISIMHTALHKYHIQHHS